MKYRIGITEYLISIIKYFVLLIILGGAGYLIYEDFSIPWIEDYIHAKSTTLFMPIECRIIFEIMEDYMYSYDEGKGSIEQLDFRIELFKSCLREDNFSDSEINILVDKAQRNVTHGYSTNFDWK